MRLSSTTAAGPTRPTACSRRASRRHAEALAAAQAAAEEQRVPGATHVIEWEDEQGRWHTETARGSDRPMTEVRDKR